MSLIKWLFYCFPFIKWVRDHFKIKKQIDLLLNQKYVVEVKKLNFDDENLFVELDSLNKKELKRKEMMEDKGKSILLILTLTGTILIGTINLLFENGIDVIQMSILFFGIFYLILSICLILLVINASMFSDLTLEDTFNIIKNEKSKDGECKFCIANVNEYDKIGELVHSIKLNQLILLSKANDLSCGLTALKRSFIIFFIFIFSIGINIIFPNTTIHILNIVLNFF